MHHRGLTAGGSIILLIAIASFAGGLPDSQNPYRVFDDRIEGINLLNSTQSGNLLTGNFGSGLRALIDGGRVVDLKEAFNYRSNLSSRLAEKLFYYFSSRARAGEGPETGGWDPEGPFSVSPARLVLSNLTLYSPEHATLTLTLRGTAAWAQVIDAVSNSDQVEAEIGGPAATGSAQKAVLVSVRAVAKRTGGSPVKIYLLVRVDKRHFTVITVDASLQAARAPGFALMLLPHAAAQIRFNKPAVAYLWLRNLATGGTPRRVTGVAAVGGEVGVAPPRGFKARELAELRVPAELMRRLGEDPDEFWSISAGDERPIAELRLARGAVDAPSVAGSGVEFARVEQTRVRVEVDGKQHEFGFLVHANWDLRFWDHEQLNLGVMTDRNTWHMVSVFVANRLGTPCVLRGVAVEIDSGAKGESTKSQASGDQNDSSDFEVRVASRYSTPLPLPFANERFLLLRLLVRFRGSSRAAHLRGFLRATLDAQGAFHEERLSFFSFYHSQLFRATSSSGFVVDARGLSSEVAIQSLAPAALEVSKIELLEAPRNDKRYEAAASGGRVGTGRFAYLSSKSALKIDFPSASGKAITPVGENRFFMLVQTLENVVSVPLGFFYKGLLCARVDLRGGKKLRFSPCSRGLTVRARGIDSRRPSPATPSRPTKASKRERKAEGKSDRKSDKFAEGRASPAGSARLGAAVVLRNPTPAQLMLRRFVAGDFSRDLRVSLRLGLRRRGSPAILRVRRVARRSEQLLNLPILPGEKLRLSLGISSPRKIEETIPLQFELAEGFNFVLQLHVRLGPPAVKPRPPRAEIDLPFPGPPRKFSFDLVNSLDRALNITAVSIRGPDYKAVRIVRGTPVLRPGVNEKAIELLFNPGAPFPPKSDSVSSSSGSGQSKAQAVLSPPTPADLAWLRASSAALSNLVLNDSTPLAASLHLRTPSGSSTLSIRARLRPAEILPSHLNLGAAVSGATTRRGLRVRNPFDQAIEFSLHLLPKSVLDAPPPADRLICFASPMLPSDTLKFLARAMYLEGLDAPMVPRPGQSVCFREPRTKEEKAMLEARIAKVNNFFLDISRVEAASTGGNAASGTQSSPTSPSSPSPAPVIGSNGVGVGMDSEVYLHPSASNRTFILAPGESTILPGAVVLSPRNGQPSPPLIIIAKNNITSPLVSSLAYSQIPFALEFAESTDQFILSPKISYINNRAFFPPMIHTILLRSVAPNPQRIKSVEVLTPFEAGCVRVLDFGPTRLEKGQTAPVRVAFFPCRKIMDDFAVPLRVVSAYGQATLSLKIQLSGFYIKSVQSELEREVLLGVCRLLLGLAAGLGGLYALKALRANSDIGLVKGQRRGVEALRSGAESAPLTRLTPPAPNIESNPLLTTPCPMDPPPSPPLPIASPLMGYDSRLAALASTRRAAYESAISSLTPQPLNPGEEDISFPNRPDPFTHTISAIDDFRREDSASFLLSGGKNADVSNATFEAFEALYDILEPSLSGVSPPSSPDYNDSKARINRIEVLKKAEPSLAEALAVSYGPASPARSHDKSSLAEQPPLLLFLPRSPAALEPSETDSELEYRETQRLNDIFTDRAQQGGSAELRVLKAEDLDASLMRKPMDRELVRMKLRESKDRASQDHSFR